jgi:alkylation response protein AidB-like acyl-CoA dehydrogenase
MDLGLNEAQQMLKTTARAFLEAECPPSYVREMEEDERGFTAELWAKIADQGWLGLIVPEAYGGVGMNFFDLSLLLEETGRALLPAPLFSDVVLGSMAIADAGTEAQKEEMLPGLAQGQTIVTMALTEPNARLDAAGIETRATPATPGEDGFRITGTKLFVPYAHVSDYLIVAARTGDEDEDITLFLVPRETSGVSQELLKTIASDRQSEVVFDDASVPLSAVLGETGKGWETIRKVLAWGAAGKCAEMVGGAQAVLDMTVEYAKQRVQFGRPIGSFQAIQHHCADMATDVEGSRYLTHQAAWRLSSGLPAEREVAIAKAWVSDAYGRVCAVAHQCHGAIGFTKEHDMQLYSRRAKAAEVAFGDSDHHLETVATAIGL